MKRTLVVCFVLACALLTAQEVGQIIRGFDLSGNSKVVRTDENGYVITTGSSSKPNYVAMADSASLDAFGRLRVSNPQTLFDSKNIFDDEGVNIDAENQPLFYDNQQVSGGFVESGGNQLGNAGSGERGIDNAILLGSLIDGTVDTIVLCVRPIAGSTNVDVEASLNWREIQ